MAQKPQIVDITKSYLPGDPNAFVQNLVNTDREDGEEKTLPLVPYEGYNFLPTSYGYKSFFGTNSQFGISALSSRVQHVLLYQIPTYKSRLIALCEDGIWVCTADGQHTSWVQVVTHTFDAQIYEEWTWCVIENVLYMYKQGTAQVYKTAIGTWTIPAGAPTVGDIVGLPSAYQAFVVTDGNLGADTDFWNGNYYEIFLQYSDGTDFGLQETSNWGLSPADGDTSFTIAVSGTPPNTADRVRVYIYDDDLGDTFYKDFLLSAFPLSILDLTGFSLAAGFEAQTLYEDGPPSTPELILSNDLTITSFVPSFLNMAGQLGIFKAGLRLGMWDSANSVSWSSNLDLTDFTPSIENLAGNTIFGSVVGRVVHCRGHGEGFIVYSTKSIVGATFSASGNLLWDAKKILDNTGISFSRAVSTGKTDSEHFVFATTGIYALGKYNPLAGKYDAEPIIPEIYDFLKESRDPVYLTVLQDRYLCFSLIADDYLYGKQSFSTGWANPYVAVVDWYVPSVTYPAPTEFLLPEQIYEIIRDEMSGSSSTKRKDGEWIPRYTTTVDRMDDRYYSFASNWIGISSTGLASYDDYSTYFNTLPVELTLSDMNTYLNPRRPTSPPDASRYGRLYTQSGIRAFWGLMGVSDTANNEAMLYLQEGEWDAFIRHQVANKTRLLAYELETSTPETSLVPIATTNVPTVIGTLVTGEGNNEWLVTEGPSDKAAKEVILRRTFNKGFEITKRVITVHDLSDQGQTQGASSGLTVVPTTVSLVAYNEHYTFEYRDGVTVVGTGIYQRSGISTDFTETYTRCPPTSGASPDPTLGDYIAGNNIPAYGLTPQLALMPVDAYFDTFTGSIRTVTVAGPITTKTGSGSWTRLLRPLLSGNAVATTTYESADVTGQYGYSQYRALVTHWDRIRFGLYGDFTILETVAAEAMTAKVWEGTYPSDLGEGRDQLWSYGQYKAIRPVDLASGKIGSLYVAANDPDGTALVATTGFSTEGITSLHTSFTLPGASFLLQTGSIEASYPTFVGALVLDMHLKKWGKYKGSHKVLLETTPINTAAFGNITYTDLGANAGIIDSTGLIFLFDSAPLDSWIRWGKIGYYRQGFSNLLEVRASMRNPSDFVVITESSMDGKILDLNKNTYTFYYDEVVAESYMDISARWHTVKIAGNFDLTGLEVRATLAGRR